MWRNTENRVERAKGHSSQATDMPLKVIKRPAVGLAIGFAVGVLMVVLAFAVESDLDATKIWNGINAPALRLADCWSDAKMPPKGEIAWLVVPSVMVLVQWSFIGLLVGFGWMLKSSRITPK